MNSALVVRARYARCTRGVIAGAACVLFVRGVCADLVEVVNELRTAGCEASVAAGTPARPSTLLDAAARELARNSKLDDALARVGYPAVSAASFHVRGAPDDSAIRTLLSTRHCAMLNDPRFADLGVHRSGGDAWIVVAARAEVPFAALQDPIAVAQRVLELVNAARAEERRCGGDRFGAAPPLALSEVLGAAAALHSLDMAGRGELSHEGADGSVSGDRITRAGYMWRASGENVASGQRSAEAVVAAWLDSPGHCATLMQPQFTDTGIAYALAPGKNPDVYWTQVFGAPR